MLLDHPTARVLLLSATPYKMLTNAEDDESHFEGFERTVKFLLGAGSEEDLRALRMSLGELRAGILGHRDPNRLAAARDRAQSILRSVMVRTERLSAAPDRDGMLDISPPDIECTVTPADVDSFVAVDKAAQVLANIPSMIEYWKSAPYLFNFMDGYTAKKRVREQTAREHRPATGAQGSTHAGLQGHQPIQAHRPAERTTSVASGRFGCVLGVRRVVGSAGSSANTTGRHVRQRRTLTKRLVFSSWSVVPKSVASLTSYEFERRHGRVPAGQAERPSYSKVREGSRPFDLSTLRGTAIDNFTGWFALLLPCKYLADIADPIAVAQRDRSNASDLAHRPAQARHRNDRGTS